MSDNFENQLKYRNLDTLFDIVQCGDVRLIKGSWLISESSPRRLERRQDLPEEAFWDPEELRVQDESVEVVVVSYCWLSKDHPDPDGVHLRRLKRAVKLRLGFGA